MGFEKAQQWTRHRITMTNEGYQQHQKIACERCKLEFPHSVFPNIIVLTKEDRLFIGDHPGAKDCHAL